MLGDSLVLVAEQDTRRVQAFLGIGHVREGHEL